MRNGRHAERTARFGGARLALTEHPALVALTLITLAAAALRFASIDAQSLDHDETVTAARVLGHGFGRSMHVAFNGERSPPLYYVVAWIWSQAFGLGAIALRSLSVICGILTVIAAYLAGRELASRRAGLIAALLVAVNPYLIWYSQEARSYGMFAMWAAFGLYFFARALRRGDRASFAGWAAISALALATHYFAAFIIAPEAALLLARRPSRRRALAATAALAAVGAALLPLALNQEGSGRTNGFTQFPVLQRAETALIKYSTAEGSAPQGGITSTTPGQRELAFVAALIGVLAAALAIRAPPPERRGALRAAAVAATAFGAPIVLALAGLDFVDPRNTMAVIVPALVVVAIGLASVRARWVAVLGAVAIVVTGAIALRSVATTPALQRHNWRAGAAALPDHTGASLYVVPADGRAPLQYYRGRSLPHFDAKSFPDGVATSTVVVMSDSPDITRPGPAFHEISTHTAPQHWTIRTYRAATPRVIDPAFVAGTKVMLEPSAALVLHATALRHAEQLADAHGEHQEPRV